MILSISIRHLVTILRGFAVLLAVSAVVLGCAAQQDTKNGAVAGPDTRGRNDDAHIDADKNPVDRANEVGKFPSTIDDADAKSPDEAQFVTQQRPEPAVMTSRRERSEAQAVGLASKSAVAADMSVAGQCCYRHPPVPPLVRYPAEPLDRENYAHVDDNPLRLVRDHPVSTFSIDVDTGAYANVRRMLNEGRLPPEDAVRVEELINYFSYNYEGPRSAETPFSVNTEIAPAPWNKDKLLMQIGIKGFEVPANERKPANLVFLIDVSGSMQSADKLGLLKSSMTMLARQLSAEDRIAIAVYAGASGVVLESTPGNHERRIVSAIQRLQAGGSTNGASGIRLAYDLAAEGFVDGGINRILLATDGDFNVGTVDFDTLIDLAERKRETGVSLTTLGFGTGNYNDHLLEQLADAGNGNYAYIDGLSEGRKVLVDELSATLQTIAKDVKIQVEFNPETVAEYRLIGYENRALRREDFNNDKIDAGEIGAGHTVTAIYELTLSDSNARLIDPLRYGTDRSEKRSSGGELAFVRLRYKAPDGERSKLIERPVHRNEIRDSKRMSDELAFAASVAGFGQLLKGGEYLGEFGYDDVADLARSSRGEDMHGYRSEFYKLVRLAESLADSDPRQARR